MMTVAGPIKFGPNNARIDKVRPAIQWQKGKMGAHGALIDIEIR